MKATVFRKMLSCRPFSAYLAVDMEGCFPYSVKKEAGGSEMRLAAAPA